MGHLLFARLAWVYSTIQPFGVGKWVPATAGKVQGRYSVCATLLGARHVPARLCGGPCLQGRYNKCSTFTEPNRRELDVSYRSKLSDDKTLYLDNKLLIVSETTSISKGQGKGSVMELHLTATEWHLPYGITQC